MAAAADVVVVVVANDMVPGGCGDMAMGVNVLPLLVDKIVPVVVVGTVAVA